MSTKQDQVPYTFIKKKGKVSEPVNVTVVNTGNVSSIKAFNIGDDWEIFSECLDQFLKAIRVEEERKASIIITSITEKAYKMLKNLCYSQKLMRNHITNLLLY